jgi:hypothetical protein
MKTNWYILCFLSALGYLLKQPPATPEGQVPTAFLELLGSGAELTLVLEGTKNLPYDATVLSVDPKAMQAVLKTFRPMPPKMSRGAHSVASLAALGEHWKARLIFHSRTGYLQYLFGLPATMAKSGRREHQRFPFTLRENVYIYVQDASFPGIGSIGTMLDLSMGGLVFRPERAFRVEDKFGLRLNPDLYHRGKVFPIIRINGLHGFREPIVLRGEVAHVSEKLGNILVAFAFGMMEPLQMDALSKAVALRAKKPSGEEHKAKPDTPNIIGRRQHTRYPYRPREDAYVHVQNADLPGITASGPLFDLSSGGLVFRPDRAYCVEDGARLELRAAMFEKGAIFPFVRVDRLKGFVGQARLRGEVANVYERGGDIYVAFVFGTLEPGMAKTLSQMLEARTRRRVRFTFLRYLEKPYSE